MAAADYALNAPRYNQSSFPEDRLLAQDCLERAVRLDPAAARARTMLADHVSNQRRHAVWRRFLEVAPAEQYDALAALPAARRFEAMAQAAVGALKSARGAGRHNDRNLARYVELKTNNARRFALEVLALAPRFENMPDAGLSSIRPT